MSGARIAIDGTDPIRMRAASALLADHRFQRVGLLGRTAPSAWGDRAVAIESARGWDFVIGLSEPASIEVSAGPTGDLSWAGPTGLARSLGAHLDGATRLAGTVPGEPIAGGERFGFPPPLGWLGGELIDGIHHCPTRGSVAAVMATSETGKAVVVLDDRQFLDGALLAAGAVLAVEGQRGPVWESAERYLEVIRDFGLVLADIGG